MSIIQNQKIRVSEMDFASIKENFKEYLRANSEFADYDFEASALSSLLDVMAYNTYYNSVMANFTANETFMDSAVKRESVVSLAKNLGYRPKSVKSSKAKINLILTEATGAPQQLVLKTGTPFETMVNDIVYQFVPLSDVLANRNVLGEYNFGDFYVHQGQFQQNRFTSAGTKAEIFTLPNPDVDMSSISVIIQQSTSNQSYEYWSHADNVVDVDETSKVFFVQEGLSNKTQIYFGDGILGKQLAAGNIIWVTYLTSAGQGANGAKQFKMIGNIEGNTICSIRTIEKASGGADPEDIDSIRFNAKTYFGVQNRAVTTSDYRSLILQNFQNVKSCLTWGGEKHSPPQYGKIFICIQPQNSEYLTYTEIEDVKSILAKRSVANITPIIINPEYIDIEVNTKVFYDPLKNDKTSLDLSKSVLSAITEYSNSVLGKFDTTFRYSVLGRVIDESDYSILNNLTEIKMYRAVLPVLSTYNDISISYNNKIVPGSLTSTKFRLNNVTNSMIVVDDGAGLIQLKVIDDNGNYRVFKPNAGTINYATGNISIEQLFLVNYEGTELKFYATPVENDVTSNKHVIVRLQPSNVTISTHADTSKSGY